MCYHISVNNNIDSKIIDKVFLNVFRKDYKYPGFTVLSFGEEMGSEPLRRAMVELKKGLSARCEHHFGAFLDYSWLTRFDQQATTKYHRDNAPADSFLLLGYEPTKVESKLGFADYHQFISDHHISVDQYYENYNPMFKKGEQELGPYITEVKDFDKRTYKIVVINNSEISSHKTFGVLHKAEMITQDASQPRIVNSMMLHLKPQNRAAATSAEDVLQFIETSEINA